MQGTLPALRAEADICIPYLLQEVRYLQAGETLFESLMSLQPEDQRKVSFPEAVVQETVVTDLLKTGGKHVHQKTTDELRAFQCNRAPWLTCVFCPCGEGYKGLRDSQDAAVGNGDPVRIASKVLNGIAKGVECLLDIRAPVLPIKGVPEGVPFIRVLKSAAAAGEIEFSAPVQVVQA